MAIVVASLANLTAWCSAVLGASPEDQSFVIADTTQGKYSPDHITLAIKYADLEIRRIIQETIGQGWRDSYMAFTGTLTPTPPATSVAIPGHSGKIGQVEVLYADGNWRPGILVTNFESIIKMQKNPDSMYGTGASLEGRYHITEDELAYFIGTGLRVKLPTELTIGSVLGSPQCYEPAVGRRAIQFATKDGIDPVLFGEYSQWAVMDEQAIRGNAGFVPSLDAFTRAGG